MPVNNEAINRLYNMTVVDPIYGDDKENNIDNSNSKIIRIIETTTITKEVLITE